MESHGLSDFQLAIVREILAAYADKIEQVSVFGSRATGRFRPDSDIDLVIDGTLTQQDVDRLWTLFDSSLLPVKVDIVAYQLITSAALREHIDRVRRPLFDRTDLADIALQS